MSRKRQPLEEAVFVSNFRTEVKEVWITKRKWQELEKRVADLEKKQNQPQEIINAILRKQQEQMFKSGHSSSCVREKPIRRAGTDLSSRSTEVSKKFN